MQITSIPGYARYLIGMTEYSIYYISINDRCILCQVELDYFPTNFLLKKDYIVLFTSERVVVEDNWLYSEKVNVSGSQDQVQKLQQGLVKYFKSGDGKLDSLESSVQQCIIFPHLINIMHIYTYTNQVSQIEKIINSDVNMIATKDGDTPLSISFINGNKVIAQLLVNVVCQSLENNNNAVSIVEASLTQLNRHGFSVLETLYSLGFKITSDESLSKTCQPNITLPIMVESTTNTIDKWQFEKAGLDFEEKGQNIEFLTSYFRVPLEPGAEKSLELLESLQVCSCMDIFRTRFIRNLIHYKWEKVKYVLYIQAIMYYVYLVGLLFLLTYREEIIIQVIMLVLNLILLIYEIIQLWWSGYRYYFKDSWNLIDISRALFLFAFLINIVYEMPEEVNEWLLFVTTLLSFIRGISYFRLFYRTRYLVNMIFQVIRDMRAFLFVLIYSTISFAFIQWALDEHFQKGDIKLHFQDTYLMILGEFGDIPENVIVVIVIVLLTIFNTIMLLNLIISVIDDTYDRVQSDLNIIDIRELIKMVIEAEYIVSRKKPRDKWLFFQVCRKEGKEQLRNEHWEGKVRVLMNMIKKLTPDVFGTYLDINWSISKQYAILQKQVVKKLTTNVNTKIDKSIEVLNQPETMERISRIERDLGDIREILMEVNKKVAADNIRLASQDIGF